MKKMLIINPDNPSCWHVFSSQFEIYERRLFFNQNNNKRYVIVYNNGNIVFYIDGLLQRLDGPAVIYADGSRGYYVEGKYYGRESNEHYLKAVKEYKEKNKT